MYVCACGKCHFHMHDMSKLDCLAAFSICWLIQTSYDLKSNQDLIRACK